MAQSPGQAFACTGCSLKENSTRVLPGKVARVFSWISSALVLGNTAKLGKPCSLFPGKILVWVGERGKEQVLVLSMEQSRKEQDYTQLLPTYLWGISWATTLQRDPGWEVPQCVLMHQCVLVPSTLKMNGNERSRRVLCESRIW